MTELYEPAHRSSGLWSDPGGAVAILLASVGGNLLSLALPLAILQLYDRIIPAHAVETLVVLLAGVTVALVLEALLSGVRATLIAWAGARYEHGTSRRLFARLFSADPAALRTHGAGLHAERFAAVLRIREFSAGQGLSVLADLPFALLFLGLIYIIGGWVAAIPVAVLAVFAAVLLLRDRSNIRVQREADDFRIRQLSFVLETLGQIASIKAAGLEASMTRRFERLLRGVTRAEHGVARASVTGQVLQSSIGGASMVAVAAGGSLGVMSGHLTLGELAACTLLANRALQPLQRSLGLWSGFRQQELQRRHVAAGLSLPTSRPARASVLPPLQGSMVIEDVSVSRKDGEVPILDGVTLSVSAGDTVGITGGAGSGKTALLMVMAGLRRPDRGRILLDGCHDPAQHSEDSLLGQVVYVSSRAPVFSGTLMENMTGFAPRPYERDAAGAPLDRTRALDLADRLGLTDLAGRLPDGFNTEVGPGSLYALSDGIAQRLALVRALYCEPRILLFDAANSALDSGGDALIRQLLLERRGHRTVIIVSQRPSLLAISDRLYTLSGGQLHRTDMDRPGTPRVPQGVPA